MVKPPAPSPLRPPAHIVRVLRLRHPSIRLLWDRATRTWQMWQRLGTSWFKVMTLGRIDENDRFRAEKPTMRNTVMALDFVRPDRFGDRWKIERMLDSVQGPEQETPEKHFARGRDERKEHAGDLYRKLKLGRIVVPRAGEALPPPPKRTGRRRR